MKGLIKFIVAIMACFSLTSCAMTNDVPVYKGASIEHISLPKKAKVSYDDLIPNPDESSKVSYFVKPSEKVEVNIKLDNPQAYEILSLTINDIKYQSFQFKEASTSNNIIINMSSPATPGEYSYTIDKIKYIDGTEIKDADMSKANKTITFGVRYTKVPTVNIINKELSYSKFSGHLEVNDPEGLIAVAKSFKAYLFDDSNKIYATAEVISNAFSFTNLNQDTSYHFVLAMSVDLLDGKGSKTIILNEFDIKTKAIAKIDITLISDTASKFSITYLDSSVLEKKIILKDESSEVELKNDGIATNLLANHNYEIVVILEYKGEEIRATKSFKTNSKVMPRITSLVVSQTEKSIAYKYSYTDPDKMILNSKVNLYKGEELIKSLNLTEARFDNLLSNTLYSIEVEISYDLLDGKGIQVLKKYTSIKTKALKLPVLDDFNVLSTKDTLKGKISFKELSSNPEIESVDLYKGSKLIASKKELSFSNLEPYTSYTIKINVSYDLNEGRGREKIEFTKDTHTSDDFKINNLKQTNSKPIGLADYLGLSFEINEDISVKEIAINGIKARNIKQNGKIITLEVFNNGAFIGGNTPINFDYIIALKNGIEYTYASILMAKPSIKINGELIVNSVSLVDENMQEAKDIYLNQQGLKLLLNVDNPTGYTIKEINVRGLNCSPFKKLNEHEYILDIYSLDSFDLSIDSIIYQNESYEGSIKPDPYLRPISNGGILHKTIHIKTALDLARNTQGKLVLDNDIDMEGLDWKKLTNSFTKEFNCIIDGNNHSIKNLKINEVINPLESSVSEYSIGLFPNFNGTIKNLTIDGFSININVINKDSPDYDYFAGLIVGESPKGVSFENVTINANSEISLITSRMAYSYVGGFLGYGLKYNTFTNCVNKAGVYGSNAGGLAGLAYDTNIISSHNEGLIGAKNEDEARNGIRYIAGLISKTFNARIVDSYNIGPVMGSICVAGLVCDATNILVDRCYNSANVTALRHQAAGLIFIGLEKQIIKDSYNVGKIKASEKIAGLVYFGAFNTVIYNCYNAGALEASNGIYGLANFSETSGNTKIVIFNCFSYVKIEEKNTATDISFFAESKNDIYTFYNLYSSHELLSKSTHIFGKDASLEEFNSKDFYLNKLSFKADIWNLDNLDFKNNKYPTLK